MARKTFQHGLTEGRSKILAQVIDVVDHPCDVKCNDCEFYDEDDCLYYRVHSRITKLKEDQEIGSV